MVWIQNQRREHRLTPGVDPATWMHPAGRQGGPTMGTKFSIIAMNDPVGHLRESSLPQSEAHLLPFCREICSVDARVAISSAMAANPTLPGSGRPADACRSTAARVTSGSMLVSRLMLGGLLCCYAFDLYLSVCPVLRNAAYLDAL